ncbi:MAG TPA: hypothetical protein VEF91_01075 [Verrucomicrobiae bacterium]|nr:hypothetical protein [Verrucomicrobiae bacterium]
MTNSLLVNCSLQATTNEALLEAVRKFSEPTVIQFEDIGEDHQVGKDIDCVVISGSAARIVNPSHRHMFQGVVNLIKTCNLPMLGICYGHQLLCWTFGAKVGSLSQPVFDRFENVRVVDVDEIFACFAKQDMIPLSESHYDYVLKESLDKAGMELLADSVSREVRSR